MTVLLATLEIPAQLTSMNVSLTLARMVVPAKMESINILALVPLDLLTLTAQWT